MFFDFQTFFDKMVVSLRLLIEKDRGKGPLTS